MRGKMSQQTDKEPDDLVFDFEKLDLYQLALRLVHKLMRLFKTLPDELQSSLGNNLVGAGMSIVNNIVKGSAKTSSEEKRECYAMSLDSAHECIPAISLLHREGCMTDASKDDLRKDCLGICKKIEQLIQSAG